MRPLGFRHNLTIAHVRDVKLGAVPKRHGGGDLILRKKNLANSNSVPPLPPSVSIFAYPFCIVASNYRVSSPLPPYLQLLTQYKNDPEAFSRIYNYL